MNYKILLTVLISLLVVSCGNTTTAVPIVVDNAPIHASPLILNEVTFIVITKDNVDTILNDEDVLISLTINEYEDLVINMSRIKELLETQRRIIIFLTNSKTDK